MGKLLFEIGVEEIPARFLPFAKEQIEKLFPEIISEYRLVLYSLKIFMTPRRIAFIAHLSGQQHAEEKLIWGPPAHISFDEEGNPKEPAIAFAKSQGTDLKDLMIKPKGKGNYVCAILKEKGKETEEILPEILKNFIFSLTFPKMMRWGNGDLRFVRPIRWLLALYDNKIIPFEINGINARDCTYGHRFLSEKPLIINSIDDYERTLERNFVIVDQDKRKILILDQVHALAKNVKGQIVLDRDLLEEVVYLVEFPHAVLCSFSENYLALPKELLITVMKDHQRYFAISDEEGNLKNYFVVISNTEGKNDLNIRKGAERVIKARFEDAKFYFTEDLKKGIHRLLELTKGIIYHKKLGSLYDKTLRICNVATKLSEILMPHKVELIKLAATYCKIDLASGVVGEFPELQGIMGGYYAEHAQLPPEVCQAIKQHYLPRSFSDEIPTEDMAAILSIADKLDHIFSFFYLGQIPSGTEDPFGLRRAANGIIAILLKRKYPLNLETLLNIYEEFPSEQLKQKVLDFLIQRLESFYEGAGFNINLIKTVSHLMVSLPLYEIEARLEAVRKFKDSENFERFFLAIKRVANIIKNYEKSPFNTSLFMTNEEKELYSKMEEVKGNLKEHLKKGEFLLALKYLDNLTPTINKFFDNVLVMDKDERIKTNRMALLQELYNILRSVADISKIM